MNCGAIISRAESLQILRNDLQNAALEQHAAELAKATEARRQEVLAQINREIEQELRCAGGELNRTSCYIDAGI